jgi:hypothetical protein
MQQRDEYQIIGQYDECEIMGYRDKHKILRYREIKWSTYLDIEWGTCILFDTGIYIKTMIHSAHVRLSIGAAVI